MRYFFGSAVLVMIAAGCAGKPVCRNEIEEPISVCRAERSCGKGSFGLGLGMALSGMGAGMSHSSNQSVDNYNQCVDRNLYAQKLNADK